VLYDRVCQMVCFQTKNPNLGKFWRASELKMLVYFMVIWNILWSFGIYYGHLVMLWQFGTFSLVSVRCVKKHVATLLHDTIFTDRINPIFCCTTLSVVVQHNVH
jgi:hypothetical protein